MGSNVLGRHMLVQELAQASPKRLETERLQRMERSETERAYRMRESRARAFLGFLPP